MKCEDCRDTGFYGDLGAGVSGNREYVVCDQCAKGAVVALHEQRTWLPVIRERDEARKELAEAREACGGAVLLARREAKIEVLREVFDGYDWPFTHVEGYYIARDAYETLKQLEGE
jgi:ribosomal protein S27AE